MNWMNLSNNFLRICGTIIFIVTLAGPLSAQQGTLDKLREKFEAGEIFQGEFTHQYIDSYTQDTSSSSGEIWVGKDRYKVRTQNQSVVVDGETSMVYSDNRNRVIISKYDPEEDDFAPSRILSGIDSTFTVSREEKVDNHINLLLASDDPFAIYQKVEIVLTSSLIPLSIEALDPADNLIITRFENGRFIEASRGMFRLDYPDEAEIVDMRN